MVTYSRHQLLLLLGLVAAAGAGLAIGEWRRANPELTATIESIDRVADDERGVTSPVERPGPTRSTTIARATTSNPIARPAGKDVTRPGEPVDLNRATADELTRLPGIGPVLAARIVAARDARGPFSSVDDLRRVSGVGAAKLAGLKEFVTVSSSSPGASAQPSGASAQPSGASAHP